MQDIIEKKRLSILQILQNTDDVAISSHKITRKLKEMGYKMSERTVRFHLLSLDKDGYTEYFPKKGRRITEQGINELLLARAYEKVGFLSTKIDRMTYKMHFDIYKKEGNVVINLSHVKLKDIKKAWPLMCKVLEKGLGMGKFLVFFKPGEKIGQAAIPEDCIGIGTVCSITINGILLQHGIPVKSRFGGLLEIQESKPNRFVAIINYDGTSLDPLEIFIKSGMTNYTQAVKNGNGLIGASFREMPSESRSQVEDIAEKIDAIGLGCFMKIGYPGKSLCEIPVNDGSFGSIIIGGLNPMAILEEYRINVQSKALSCLIDYKKLFPYTETEKRLKSILNK